MKNYNRDLLLLYKDEVYNDDLLQKEVECLHGILMKVEHNDVFCVSHELVTRNKITQKAKKNYWRYFLSRVKAFLLFDQ